MKLCHLKKKIMNDINSIPPINALTNYLNFSNRFNLKHDVCAEKATDLLNVMIFRGHEPNVVTYNTLINGLSKKGAIEKAMDFLRDMVFKGHKLML
jgi:pentatricopeptide repeat protein